MLARLADTCEIERMVTNCEAMFLFKLSYLLFVEAPSQIYKTVAMLTMEPMMVLLTLFSRVVAFGSMFAAMQDK